MHGITLSEIFPPTYNGFIYVYKNPYSKYLHKYFSTNHDVLYF